MPIRLKISWKYKLWLLLALVSCSPAPVVDYGFGEYYVEIVTALGEDAFLLDNGQTIYDSHKTAKKSFDAGDRVFLYFSYGNNPSDPITVHRASKIFSDTLRTVSEDAMPQQADDPIRLESAWIGSHYLNLRFYFEFHSKPHRISLMMDETQVDDSEIHLYFLHDRNNDNPGYPTLVYASYDLSNLLRVPQGDRVLFVHFNTSNYGNKTCIFKY